MSDHPTVCAVMLTANRPELARRAVECFRAQKYPEKRLLIVNQSQDFLELRRFLRGDDVIKTEFSPTPVCVIDKGTRPDVPERGASIGEIRNYAAGFGQAQTDILIHWDDDDWSHPNRIAEQVALLQSSGADAVGYNEMLFWREDARSYDDCHREVDPYGEAWLYTGSILGTSLCYWRKTWERRPFQAKNEGEDYEFLKGLKTAAVSSRSVGPIDSMPPELRMIARIHAGNTSSAYADLGKPGKERWWKRVPAWDNVCREVMER